jgi:hypothetical protein
MNLARCVLTPRSSKGVRCVNFPLSTYSVLGKKNVSQKKENTFEGLKGLYIVRGTGQLDAFLIANLDFKATRETHPSQIIARDVGVWRASA